MDPLLSILVVLAIAVLVLQAVLITAVLRRVLGERRSRIQREARQARRYAPSERPLLP